VHFRRVQIARRDQRARGLRNRDIGDELHISEGTVKMHLHHVFAKLDCDNRVEMLLRARERGVV
jgi:two-component system nitrate/nitrite response regulator NarP